MKNKIVKQLLGISVATVLFASMPMLALAEEYNISAGSIKVDIDAGGNRIVTQADVENPPEQEETVITGSNTSENYIVTINTEATGDNTGEVTFKDFTNDVGSYDYSPAVLVKGGGNLEIELDGTNTLKSGSYCAGIQKENSGTLTIKDDNPSENDTPDSLTATGGILGAGIGGGYEEAGTDIIIEGGKVTATGGSMGAGIGGGYDGNGTVTINGGEVTATGGSQGAGIGSGSYGTGEVTITGGTVVATGGYGGAGIGGGFQGAGTVTIEGEKVTATGGSMGAGIGGGRSGAGTVTINGGDVIATGGNAGAGIGGGSDSTGSSLKVSGSAVVKASGGTEYALSNYGAGAAIGEGGNSEKINNVWTPVEGSYIDIDTTELGESGFVIFYKPGIDAQEMIDHPTNNIYQEHPYIGQLPFEINTEESVIIHTVVPKQNNDNNNSLNNNNDSETATPGYTGITIDILLKQINSSLLTTNGGAVTIDFGRNICLTPELMKTLFETGNVAKNCTFTYKGKRYNLYIPVIDTKSDKYLKAMDELKKEDNGKGFAGFMRTKDIFKDLGVTVAEIKQ